MSAADNPFAPNLKLEALHAAVALEKVNVDRDDEVATGQSLVDEAETIYVWLKKADET